MATLRYISTGDSQGHQSCEMVFLARCERVYADPRGQLNLRGDFLATASISLQKYVTMKTLGKQLPMRHVHERATKS